MREDQGLLFWKAQPDITVGSTASAMEPMLPAKESGALSTWTAHATEPSNLEPWDIAAVSCVRWASMKKLISGSSNLVPSLLHISRVVLRSTGQGNTHHKDRTNIQPYLWNPMQSFVEACLYIWWAFDMWTIKAEFRVRCYLLPGTGRYSAPPEEPPPRTINIPRDITFRQECEVDG